MRRLNHHVANHFVIRIMLKYIRRLYSLVDRTAAAVYFIKASEIPQFFFLFVCHSLLDFQYAFVHSSAVSGLTVLGPALSTVIV